jgi:TP901 family phage tail tape measure protein
MAIGARQAHVEITSSASKFGKGIRDAEKKLGAFGTKARGSMRAASSAIGKVGGGLVAGLGIGGGFSFASDVVGDVLELEKSMQRFAAATGNSPEQMAKFREELSNISKATGVSKSELLGASQAYYALASDAEGATNSLGLFAKVSNATGATAADIATAAAALKDNMGIAAKDLEAAFSTLHSQGNAGSIELPNMAEIIPQVAGQFTTFAGGTGQDGLADMGAALQVMNKRFNDPLKSATAMDQLMSSLVRGSGKLKSEGIDVFDAKGNKRNFMAIIDEILAKDISEPVLQKILGSDVAMGAIGAMRQHRTLLGEIIAKGKDQGAIERDAAKFRESTAGKLQIAMNALKVAVADVFTPERIQAFVNVLGAAVEKVGQLIEGVGKVGKAIGEWGGSQVEKPSEAWQAVPGGAALGVVSGMWAAANPGELSGDAARAAWSNADAAWKVQSAKLAEKRRNADAAGVPIERYDKSKTVEENRAAYAMSQKQAPIVVKSNLVVNGNAVASAVANATDTRRSPGGR